MLNDKPQTVMTTEELDRIGVKVAKPARVMTLRFPCEVHQTDERTVEIPLAKSDYNLFSTAFAEQVYETFGTYEGDKFISEMSDMVTRRMLIAQIR